MSELFIRTFGTRIKLQIKLLLHINTNTIKNKIKLKFKTLQFYKEPEQMHIQNKLNNNKN